MARNHPRLAVRNPWQYYLERAANTTRRLGFARIGYMDGTDTREVRRSVLEHAHPVHARTCASGGPMHVHCMHTRVRRSVLEEARTLIAA